MTATLDRADCRIQPALMQDATLPLLQLADRVGLSRSPCWKPIQKQEAAGIVTGRVAIVDPAASGLGLTVFVEIEAADHTPEWRTAFAAVVEDCPGIVAVNRMAGQVDNLLQAVVSGMAACDAFCLNLTQRLPCRTAPSRFSMERMKATTALPIATAPV